MSKHLVAITVGTFLAACGGATPAPQNVSNNTGGGGGEAAPAPISLALDNVPWTIVAAAGATVLPEGEYGQRVTTAGYTLDVQPWPDSDAFVQTLQEHLDGMKENGELEVVHQVDGGRGNFEAVVRVGGQLDVTVLVRPDAGMDGAMCGAKLADGADWQAAATACRSLAPSAP